MSAKPFRWVGGLLVVAAIAVTGCAPSATWSSGGRDVAIDVGGALQVFHLASKTFERVDVGGKYAFNPVFSPDEKQLAYYAVTDSGKARTCDLWVRSANGAPGTARRLAADVVPVQGDPSEAVPRLKPIVTFSWSPDGRSIAHTRMKNEQGRIDVTDVKSGESISLRRTNQSQFMPVWAPEGDRLAYLAQNTGLRSKEDPIVDLYVASPRSADEPMRLSGGSSTELFPQWPPTWSQDGSEIVVLRPSLDERNVELYAVAVGGPGARSLAIVETPQGSVSADLKTVVFMGGQDRTTVIYRKLEGGETRILDDIDAASQKQGAPLQVVSVPLYPVLSPDGKLVALPVRIGAGELRIYDTATGRKDSYPIPRF